MASDIPQLRTPGERKALDAMPLPVRRATEAVGWRTLCDSTEPEISRAQWVKTYDAIVGRVQHERLLPAPMRALLEQIALKPTDICDGRDYRSAQEFLADHAKNCRAPRISSEAR